MALMQRYSEPYSATGGLAAEGVLNQLGRPDVESLEVLVREAVQNCWDAKRRTVGSIRVEIGRRVLDRGGLDACRDQLLVDPPPGLPLADELVVGMEMLYFADFGTDGLGGPTRADQPGTERDFVDFVRNIGQPPDKDLGGGSFGYGKAAFYIASRTRTILIDTLCLGDDGRPERRFMGCALGGNFDEGGRPYTGRHWWGRLIDGIPEPLTGEEANSAAAILGLPEREGPSGLGTTVVIVAPSVAPESDDGIDHTIEFIADALVWNFWPRLIDTPGATKHSMEFLLSDQGERVRLPNARTHPRLRGFVEAMDRLREEPHGEDELLMDRSVECRHPVQTLGRLVIQKGPVAPIDLPDRSVPQGARMTADSVHHVALMRNAELVVKYLQGASPVTGRMGYSGVFRCAVDVDEAFRRSEPPTHDDWVFRAVPKGPQRSFVKIALERVTGACREAAGYDTSMRAASEGAGIPLGEFADALATLMPGLGGPGARRAATGKTRPPRKRNAPGRTTVQAEAEGLWVDGGLGERESSRLGNSVDDTSDDLNGGRSKRDRPEAVRRPQARTSGDPAPAIASDGTPVVRYPFELRGHGSRIRVRALVEVMSNDGGQVEGEPPVGSTPPSVRAWIDPEGGQHAHSVLEIGPEGVDGRWTVEVPLAEEMMMRVDIAPEIA
jgi:hypothetical protein